MHNHVGLEDSNDDEITSMGSSWTTKDYPMGFNDLLCIHLKWTGNPQGTLYLDYSGQRSDIGNRPVEDWVTKNIIVLDGTFNSEMILDALLAVASFRLRYVSNSGTGVLSAWTTRKRG